MEPLPSYSDLPPTYDASVARISPLDASFSRTHVFTFHAVLVQYIFVPLWEFPDGNIPEYYVGSSYPGWVAGIQECNQTLRLISNRQLQLYIWHAFIFVGCVVSFFVAVLVQRGVILQFQNSKIIIPIIAALIIFLLLLLSKILRQKILSIRQPIAALQLSVARMGWVLENFHPRFGLAISPEIQITNYERSF
jgi:hypothetical protein